MNGAITDWVLKKYHPKRGHSARKFLLYIVATTANSQGWCVEETIASLAKAVGISERQAQYHMRALEREGVLQTHTQKNAANLYRVLMPGLEATKRPPQIPRTRAATGRLSCEHSTPICEPCFQQRLAA